LGVFLLGGLMTGFLDLAIIGGVALLSQPVAARVLRNDRLRSLLRGIPWVVRFVAGFGLTWVIGYVINTVRYEPLAGSEFFPLVLTVAFGLLIFQVLLSDLDTGDEGEDDEPTPEAEAAPSAGGAIGAALVIFAVGAMLQLAFPATAFADNCSGLFDCNQTVGAAAAAAAGAAAAAAGAAASRNQNRKRRKKRKKKNEPPAEPPPPPQPSAPQPHAPQPPAPPPPPPPPGPPGPPPPHAPEVELTVGPITEVPAEPDVEVTVGPITEVPAEPEVELTVGPITEVPPDPEPPK
jgi:hypothetical protein